MMGNQVTTLGQIYSTEYFLVEHINDMTPEKNLGSTRFMKVALVNHKDAGRCVAKVFAINDPTLPIQYHRQKLEYIKQKILSQTNLNALPFDRWYINDRAAILLRPYVKHNLYDRLSTRPFLSSIEKRWIAYQILLCIQTIHKQSVCHGDIKSENILITSFLWVTLADFASYKPVTIPENNPSDFSYFFDTSRRHSCNMAPERFVKSQVGSEMSSHETKLTYGDGSTINELGNQLNPQMDLFSVGCVLAELFADDIANGSLFDLGQLLGYKKEKYDPREMIEKSIPNHRIQRLICNLTDLDPDKRNSAAYHLEHLLPSLFPSYFQKLYIYIEELIPYSPDSKIFKLANDLENILAEIITENEPIGLLLPLILITSTLRSLKTIEAKLLGIKLCVTIIETAPDVMYEYVTDRLLPYIIHMLSKGEPRVRALSITSLNRVLQSIKKLSSSDSNVFVDYLLPELEPLAHDTSVLVRIALASNIGHLALTSKRFLVKTDKLYSSMLAMLQDGFGSIVIQLLTDVENNVRRAVIDHKQIGDLCEFFGKEKTNEIILGTIITFLNDRNDFRLRLSFFKSIPTISDHLGPYYAHLLKPLMQQGLSDTEEMVIHECLSAISWMVMNGSLTKEVIYVLYDDIVTFLSFPNKWIRNAVLKFILVSSKIFLSIEVHRRILPKIQSHLKREITGIKHESVLLDSLHNPPPRSILNVSGQLNDPTDVKLATDSRRSPSRGSTSSSGLPNRGNLSLSVPLSYDSQSRKSPLPEQTPRSGVTPTNSIGSSEKNQLGIGTLNEGRGVDVGGFRPRGLLLAHLHVHRKAVKSIELIPEWSLFATCSSDATIRFWDYSEIATKPRALYRSKHTMISPDASGYAKLATCIGSSTLLALTESTNTLHMIQLSSTPRNVQSISFDKQQQADNTRVGGVSEQIVGLISLSPNTYATCSTSSKIRGFDLRMPLQPNTNNADVWSLKLDGREGLITCMDGNEYCLACGTSGSVLALFDLRFLICATSMSHPLYQERIRKRVRTVAMRNDKVYCSVDANNEVSIWDCETRSRKALLATAPSFSSQQASHYSVLAMNVNCSNRGNKQTGSSEPYCIITAGTDMKIRYWDLNNPHRSYLISEPSPNKFLKSNSSPTTNVAVKTAGSGVSNVDSLQHPQQPKHQQQHHKSNQNSSSSKTTLNNSFSTNETSTAHQDSISSLATVDTHNLLLSASRDGVVKIWR